MECFATLGGPDFAWLLWDRRMVDLRWMTPSSGLKIGYTMIHVNPPCFIIFPYFPHKICVLEEYHVPSFRHTQIIILRIRSHISNYVPTISLFLLVKFQIVRWFLSIPQLISSTMKLPMFFLWSQVQNPPWEHHALFQSRGGWTHNGALYNHLRHMDALERYVVLQPSTPAVLTRWVSTFLEKNIYHSQTSKQNQPLIFERCTLW